MIINRKILLERLYKKFSGAIPYRPMYYAINIIIKSVIDDLANDKLVTVKNFGTLSPCLKRGHLANDLGRGTVRQFPNYRSVSFHPSQSMRFLMKAKF
jgi:nucleoid DNA-binding protein